MISKYVNDGDVNWDLQINACLTAIRCTPSESTGYSSFYLMYGRDPVLSLDTLLTPRRKYMGEDLSKIYI